VIDDDHRAPRAIDFKQGDRFDALGGAHACERLVEQKQAWLGRQRKPDFEPPLLAICKIGNWGVRSLSQIDERQCLIDVLVEAGNAVAGFETDRA